MSRIKSEFVVFELSVVDGQESSDETEEPMQIVARDLESSADARRWIKRNGEDGVTYQIAAIKGEPIEVEVETIKKRNLFEHAEKDQVD